MAGHAALAVHRGAGFGTATRIAGTVAARLRDHVDSLDLLVAESAAEFRAQMAARDGDLDALSVLGGDGTAHEALQFCAQTSTAFGVVPTGSGNDLARGLGLPLDPRAAMDAMTAALHTGRRRRVDLGLVGRTWFATVLCAGFDAAVTARARGMSWPRGPRRYDLAVLAELASSWHSEHLVVEADSETFELDATMIAIGNTRCYGGGIPICPRARPDDGLFDVTILGRISRWEAITMLPRMRTGRRF